MAEKNEVLKTNENIEMLEKNRNNKNINFNWFGVMYFWNNGQNF